MRRFRRVGLPLCVMLAALLVLASLLGVLHAVTHPLGSVALVQKVRDPLVDAAAPRQVPAVASNRAMVLSMAGAAASTASPLPLAPSWFGMLFHHQAGDLDCRIYDQLCHGPAAPAASLAFLTFALPTAAALMTLEGEAIARWIALFDARGPPQTA